MSKLIAKRVIMYSDLRLWLHPLRQQVMQRRHPHRHSGVQRQLLRRVRRHHQRRPERLHLYPRARRGVYSIVQHRIHPLRDQVMQRWYPHGHSSVQRQLVRRVHCSHKRRPERLHLHPCTWIFMHASLQHWLYAFGNKVMQCWHPDQHRCVQPQRLHCLPRQAEQKRR